MGAIVTRPERYWQDTEGNRGIEWLYISTDDVGPRYDVPVWKVTHFQDFISESYKQTREQVLARDVTYEQAENFCEEWYAKPSS